MTSNDSRQTNGLTNRAGHRLKKRLKKLIAPHIIAAAELARHEAEEAKKDKDQRDNAKDDDDFNDAEGEEKRNKGKDNQLECDTYNLHFTY